MSDLRRRALQGGAAKLAGQSFSILLRLGYMVVLARLLSPKDFGLVAMVTVVTGIYGLFTTAGLSPATIQKESVTEDEISTLFWVNVLIGVLLTGLCLVTAPGLAAFYGEPRLVAITMVLAIGFLFSGAGVQHVALLQRQVRHLRMTLIETFAQLVGSGAGIALAIGGSGYWSLVAASILPPAVTTICAWTAVRWIPGKPHWNAEISSMLRFGATFTANNLVVYVGYNLEKLLLGRFWGADVLGLYGRGYQLVSLPTDCLNGAVGIVTFSALSRLQTDPVKLRAYFLKGYALVTSMSIPITIFCALYAREIILVLFGESWTDAAVIFQLLTPTVLVFGMINPLSWFLLALGLQARSLKISLVVAPVVMVSYCVGLPFGPRGVAVAYSTAMILWVVPHTLWCLKGTIISIADLVRVLRCPVISGLVAALGALAVQVLVGSTVGPFTRLVLGGSCMMSLYVGTLLLVFQQKTFYFELLKGLRGASPGESHVTAASSRI
jgi:PST family polysaccharide transporter